MEEFEMMFENIMKRTNFEDELIEMVGRFIVHGKYHVELKDYNGRRSYMIRLSVFRSPIGFPDSAFYMTPPPKRLLKGKNVYGKLQYQNQLKAVMAIKRIDKLKHMFLERYYSFGNHGFDKSRQNFLDVQRT